MKKPIFFALPNLVSERWQQTFPDAVITDSSGGDNIVGVDSLCWVLTSLPGWELLVKRLADAGATVVALSLNESRVELLTTLSAGGRGYVHALATSATLQAVATAVVSGGLWLGPDFVSDLLKGINSARSDLPSAALPSAANETPSNTSVLDSLTAREREVCLLVANAHSNKEVARRLDVTERTVKAHLGSAFEKLQVRDRVQLTLLINRQEKSGSVNLPQVQNG
jgi:two-component system, NarL family, nitrate/nitrite response regulator NarL